jgi:hypothetical protein
MTRPGAHPALNPAQFGPAGGICPGAGTRKGTQHDYVDAGVDTRNMFDAGFRDRQIYICKNCGHEKNVRPPSPDAIAAHRFAETYPGPGQAHYQHPEPQPMSYQLRYRPGLS